MIPGDWDEEFEEAKAQLGLAKRQQRKAQEDLGETKLLQDRERRRLAKARKKAEEALNEEQDARRKAEEAKRNAETARRQNRPPRRWEDEAQRSLAEARSAAQALIRWEGEARRKELSARALDKEIKPKQAELTATFKTSHSLEQRMRFLVQRSLREQAQPKVVQEPLERREPGEGGEAVVAEDESDAEDLTLLSEARDSLTITSRACAALKEVLADTAHGPDQILRLNVDCDGTVRLSVEAARPNDRVVSHEGVAVLAVGSDLPQSLRGRTLDTMEAPDRRRIIISD